MKNRIVKKILRIILLTIVGAAVIGTFYFLWKKAQPVITLSLIHISEPTRH